MKKNQNLEILRLEYLSNTYKYHAKNFFLMFFCDVEHIKTGFRRFKILTLTVDIKSPIYILVGLRPPARTARQPPISVKP